ncbi:hypothetical protein SDC9_198898 [bioreactor metagenome]|uniref:Uncharacterized protein n=1 Tax=bioreactor metagenome TaxID=1076179 RepID=A0A645IIY6_9ZZZZ
MRSLRRTEGFFPLFPWKVPIRPEKKDRANVPRKKSDRGECQDRRTTLRFPDGAPAADNGLAGRASGEGVPDRNSGVRLPE